MAEEQIERVLFRVSHPRWGLIFHATAASIEDAVHYLRVSEGVMTAAGFVIDCIPEDEKAFEVDYLILVRFAVEIGFYMFLEDLFWFRSSEIIKSRRHTPGSGVQIQGMGSR